MKKTAITTLALALLALVPFASADTLSLSLSPSSFTGAPGDTITVAGTITAASDGLGAVNLLGDNINVNGPSAFSFVLDDSAFLLDAPLSMSGGDSYTGDLFTITLPSDTLAGNYTFTFDILGGVDSGDYSILTSAGGTLDVANASPVPEPGTWALLATGFGAFGLAAFARRQSAGNHAV
ncbi:MAG: PEP-CTERM sorting domain-containing protein [Edaphobacter sp.]|uniref:PEP-CTERM sorting domain-containing protein n=1 Tax=Edaphobacter sp. TaxID=1934404 RepID=UPI0023986B20|nr:PEP-CTERM sorting domain-containing protein [Edaphobacter sp.]MDE1176703.1 PEP-CTERM sorting domain-containing protein [Edaphobacter sp.]